MNKRFIISLCILLLFHCNLKAQSTAGNKAYSVLDFYNSAQMTARGLPFIPRFVQDASSSLTNPSTLNDSINNMASITYTDIFAGAYQGALAFTHSFKGIGHFGFGLQYINYGSFQQTDPNGYIEGTFSATDYLFSISYGMQVEKDVYIGVTFKPLFSKYESYSASALCFDFAATWVSKNRDWQVSAMARNIGKQISSFDSQTDSIPFDIQIGLSKRLAHTPVTFYVVADKLTKWNIRENDVLNPRDETHMDGSMDKESNILAFLDKTFRHLHFAVDIYPSQKFYLSFGYSWRQHQEMKVDDAFSLAGLSYGIGIKYKQFTFNYARNEYHNYGSPNYLTLGYSFKTKNNTKQ